MKTILIVLFGFALSILVEPYLEQSGEVDAVVSQTVHATPDVSKTKDSDTSTNKKQGSQKSRANKKPVEKWAVNHPVGQVAPEHINHALAVYKRMGLSKAGAAYLVGNFAQESPHEFTSPCSHYGDGGAALGFGQWHTARRVDMPCDVTKQLKWAVNVEMPRDAAGNGYASLSDRLRSNDVADIVYGIRQWERYGVEGLRFTYGAQIYNSIK